VSSKEYAAEPQVRVTTVRIGGDRSAIHRLGAVQPSRRFVRGAEVDQDFDGSWIVLQTAFECRDV
jgi:uncharacterized beta-barrel protein YwiB (DUF1934 family)